MGGFGSITDEEEDDKPAQLKKNDKKNAGGKKNPLFSSMDDTIGASVSHG